MNYGSTQLEKQAEEKLECRKIIKHLIDFGLTENQKIWLIKLLSLELENIELMKKIDLVVKEELTDLSLTTELKVADTESSSIVIEKE